MTYKQFVQAVEEKVREEIGAQVSVQIHEAAKNNGTVKTGLLFIEKGVNISPTIYLEEFYYQYTKGELLKKIVADIVKLYDEVRFHKSFDGSYIRHYEQMKAKIIYHLINREKNEEMLKEVPYIAYLDMAVVCYVLMDVNEFGTATMLVKEEHLRYWGVDFDTVYQDAHRNTEVLLPCRFESIGSVIAALGDEKGKGMDDTMYVLSNSIRSFGAAAVLYRDRLKEIGKYLKEDYYILPSSVHEVIIIAECNVPYSSALTEIVVDINATQVEDEEVLSDKVYHYSCARESLEEVS